MQIYNYVNEHKFTTHVYESTTYIYTCYLKSQTLNLSLFIFHYIVSIRCVQILGFSSRYAKKNTLIQHTRESRVRHNVFSIGNRHNSLKIQRNCVKYILDRSVKSLHFETKLNMSLEHSILEFGIVRVRTSIWANKRKMYHKHGMSRLLRT